MLTRSCAAQLRREALMETLLLGTSNLKRRETSAETPVPSTSNGQQRVLSQTPYRLAIQKASPKFPTTKEIAFNPNAIDEPNTTLLISSRCPIYYNATTSPNQQLSDISIIETPLISSNIWDKANLTIRQFIARIKIKPILLLILFAVLAVVVFLVMSPDSTDDHTESETWDRYSKFSHDMLELQKEYMHQSAWFWNSLRVTGWRALTEPLYSMPMGLLIVIPYKQEQVGHCLATKIVNSFNKIHNQKTMRQSNIPLFYRQTETTPTIKELSLAIQATRDAHVNAVLIDHLEKLPRATVPILDNFIHPYGFNAENKFLVFTLYLPSAHCNSKFVWDHLSYVWLIQAVNQPSLIRNLMYNTVFLNSDDDHVKCK